MAYLFIKPLIFVMWINMQETNCYQLSQYSTVTRNCGTGNYLQINSGTYVCSNLWGTTKSVTSKMNSNCNYNPSCYIQATNTWLGGDPCVGYSKYLTWTDGCYSIWGGWGSWSACPGDCTTHNLVRFRDCVKPNGGCGSAPADYISCKRLGCYSSEDISISTPNDVSSRYNLKTDCFVATGRTYFTFRARANNDITIALTSPDNLSTTHAYEIIIGGWGNTNSTIRNGIAGASCVYYSSVPLSRTYFDEFWVSFTGNYVRVGTGSSAGSGTFLTCYHAPMYSVNFIWISTGWGSSGEWRFPNDVACTHVTNAYVTVANDDTSCNGNSTYACVSGYKQVAGNTNRMCQFGSILSGYPLVCAESTCKLDILFIVEASIHTSSIHSALMTVIGDLAGSLKISSSDIQVGVITYDDIVDENIEIDQYYYSASSLDNAISSITIPSASSVVNLAEALRVGFYDSFTLSKGNRFSAFRNFVIIAKTYSSQTGTAVADHIRLNLKNQIFTIGISPRASLVTDLKAMAGDDSRYMQYNSPEEMSSHFNIILQKIAVCPTIIIQPMTTDCEIDIVFIVERYNLRYTKRFLAELMDNITVSSDGIRIGMVLFDSTASTQFQLTTHNSSEAVRGAIEAISETNRTDHLVDKGLIEARDNVFTASMGDRISASNHYVFIVGPFESYPEAVANDIRRNGSNYIYAIHIGNQYQREYQKAVDSCGDYNRYTNVDSYENLITIKDDIIQKITSCQSFNITTRDCTTGETSTVSVAPTLSLSTTRAFISTSTSEGRSILTTFSPVTYFTTTFSSQDNKLTTKSIGLIAGVAVGLFSIGFTIGYLIKMKVIKGESSSHLSKSTRNQDYLFEFPDSNRIMSWKGKFNSTDLFEFNFQAV